MILFEGFKRLFLHRKILLNTSINDVRAKYSGTMFGLLWAVIFPILFLGLYAIVYTMIFKVRVGQFTTFDYVLLIFAGLIPFLGFAEALGAGTSSIMANKGLIKNTLFPIDLIPVKAVLVSSLTMVVGLVLLLAVLWSRGEFHTTQLLLPAILFLQIIFTIGVIWLLSAFNVFFPDIGQVISVVILMLMLVSPIAYTQDMIPKNLMIIMYPNPLYYMIMLYRGAVVVGELPLTLMAIFTMVSLFTFTAGYVVFTRLQSLFSDYV